MLQDTETKFIENSDIIKTTLKKPKPKSEIQKLLELASQSNDPEEQERIDALKKKTSNIHAAWLFHLVDRSKLLLKYLSRSLASVAVSDNGSWYDFSGRLGIVPEALDCVLRNSNEDKRIEKIFLLYAQDPESTLLKVINILQECQRKDTISKVEPYIEGLVKYIFSPEGIRHWDRESLPLLEITANDSNQLDSGFESLPESSSGVVNSAIIIRPKGYQRIYLRLPLHLMADEHIIRSFVNSSVSPCKIKADNDESHGRENESLQRADPYSHRIAGPNNQKIRYAKIILLTFASDGEDAAMRIATKLRQLRTPSGLRYGVLILDENYRHFTENPELRLSRIFYKIDYVMPVITRHYLKSITSPTLIPLELDMLSSLDSQYARFIYDLILKNYVDRLCYNKKCFTVIPQETDIHSVYEELKQKPPLRVFGYEDELEKFVKRILK